MRKLIIRLVVALTTFLVGVATFVLWYIPYQIEEIPVLQSKPDIPKGWMKIDVNGRASFYLPPEMKSVMICNTRSENTGGDILEVQKLVISYRYDEDISCGDLLDALADKATVQTLHVKIDGQRAMLSRWIEKDKRAMQLCLSDVGDGKTGLNLLARYRDKCGLDIATRIFDSVGFQPSITPLQIK